MAGPIDLSPSEYKRTTSDGHSLSEWEAVVKEEKAGSVTLLGPVLAGLVTLVVGIGGFFLWATLTPVAQASVATGKIIVQSNTKTVTHLEGGTLKALAVSEGETVKQGALLAELDVTRSQSIVVQLQQQRFVFRARLARLIAERDEKKNFAFSDAVPQGMDAEAGRQLVSTEKKLFQERISQFRDQIATEKSLMEQLDSQRVALVARRESWAEQIEFIRGDYEALATLQDKQLATKERRNEKKIQLVDMQTRIAESDAAIAENKQKQTQANLSLANRRTEYFRTISEQIQQVQSDIARVQQEIISAEDIVAKSAIRSPQDGIVANIKIRTAGSALLGGQALLDIVPANQPMLIEGKARAMDIDTMRVGERAEIRLSSFGAAEAFPLIAHVTYIAPDSIIDEKTGEMTYTFRAKIDDAELKRQPNLFLYPGMTADVHIVNGHRTALAYLLSPIEKSFSRAFREQ
ncbi:MAG: type secretion rane fusion protein HlyD family [Rhizobium sp.]|nr:type secretion rane fusion protein HlyD family [Rhizobium sp.]